MADRTAVVAQLAELFREQGFAATSLPDISNATGLGRGSLYHLFPGGKAAMLGAVVEDVTGWFEREIFTPLEAGDADVDAMLDAVVEYFDGGRRLCLIGRVGLEPGLEPLRAALDAYFERWEGSLGAALETVGREPSDAADMAERVVVEIQGALVVAHARDDAAVFGRTVDRLRGVLAEA
ncbi:DNA-binding transcriptional regulator, AcrR family [Paraoerskovia marina]|uniref:DNA-binding transcriptional regulator, AcrR family n=1 Tax=Paraoerskovia marina TaxID=545619 RepID=A0A1H1Q463_9CELL|nr:TetR/AcrR family transcriptional regulator [Paraoerskovia marina]SDS18288.1 DNA-binding transcriptional regulator, AcrR family [Paraoerskovia marina]